MLPPRLEYIEIMMYKHSINVNKERIRLSN